MQEVLLVNAFIRITSTISLQQIPSFRWTSCDLNPTSMQMCRVVSKLYYTNCSPGTNSFPNTIIKQKRTSKGYMLSLSSEPFTTFTPTKRIIHFHGHIQVDFSNITVKLRRKYHKTQLYRRHDQFGSCHTIPKLCRREQCPKLRYVVFICLFFVHAYRGSPITYWNRDNRIK